MCGLEVDIRESGVCLAAGFGISGFETPNCMTREIVSDKLCLRKICFESGKK
jgi:hypothetical protein